jgi:broad specificity phosphatase PhoE
MEDCLTECGLKQAELVALSLKDIKIEKIFTSKVLRAKITGAKIGEAVNIEPTQLEYLKERRGTHDINLNYVYTESFEYFKMRLEETKSFLESLSSNKHIVVVSHSAFLKGLFSYIMLGDLLTEDSASKIDRVMVVDNASVSKFTYNHEKQKWHSEYLNDRHSINSITSL